MLLSPFEVRSTSDVGYEATETLSGSRLKTDLKDVATQVNVMTQEFLQDLAITSMDEAMSYSLNTEIRDEIIDVGAPGGLGIQDTTLGLGNGGGRTRSLGPPNKGHDFFDTNLRIDTYNTERFTFSSGPNSILFGNAQASGTIDTTFKRAQLARPRYEVSFRVDDNGSERYTTDINQPIVKNMLGLRVAGLRERQENWREPSSYDQDRLYASAVFRPFKKVSLHVYHENVKTQAMPARNTLVQDHVTPWIAAGRPTYNNGGTGALPPTANTPFALQSATNLYYALNSMGTVPVSVGNNTVTTVGFDTTTPAPDNFERSIIDPSLYPRDVNFSGNANQSRVYGWIRGAMLEVNPLPNLFIEAAINQERGKHKGIDFFDNSVAELNVDANRFLNDRVTSNPNLGRYYFQDDAPGTRKNYSYKEQKRLTLAYDLNFTEREGRLKWLGRHRFGLLFDKLQSANFSMQSSFRIADNSGRRPLIRYYISPDNMTISLPFDPLADGPIVLPGATDTAGRPVSIASWDLTTPPDGVFNRTRALQSSRLLTMQNHLLGNRVVLSFGQRKDYVDLQEAPTLDSGWDFDRIVRGGIPWETQQSDAPVTRLKSIVVHPFKWVSASYVESNSQQVVNSIRRNLDGSLPKQGSGTGKDYGLTLRWSDKLSLRVTKFENASEGNLSSVRAVNPVPSIQGTRGNNMRRDIANIERTVMLAGAPRSEKYGYYQDELARLLPTGANAGSQVQNLFDMLSDREAKGYEATLVGNPTPNWRLSVSAAKVETSESNISPQYFDFIMERLPIWGGQFRNQQFLPVTNRPGGTLTVGEVVQAAIANFNYVRLSEGHLNTLERRYRVTSTARYSFSRGLLKGSFVGANYLWRSPAAAGYAKKTITDNPFVVPGLVAATIEVDDLDNPTRGRALTSVDAFAGYSRRLLKNKLMWRVQLNVRNVLGDDGLIMQRALSDGTGAMYTVQTPRTFILTNTFSF